MEADEAGSQNSVRLDDQEGILPRVHLAGDQHQKRAVTTRQARPFDAAVEDDELLTDG